VQHWVRLKNENNWQDWVGFSRITHCELIDGIKI